MAFRNLGVELAAEIAPDDVGDFVEVWWGDPQYWQWSRIAPKARIALVLSEARSVLAQGRERAIGNVQKADLVICPSQSAAAAWLEAPIDAPIEIAPFGVASERFPYCERDWSKKTAFTFLHAGVTQFRKGSWMVPEAFIKAFKRKDNARLIVACPRDSEMFTELQQEYGNHKQMVFDHKRQDDILYWYKQAHVYVSPHLSEGFGLMIPEAMATGMPCIVSRCSAPREFFDRKYGAWIEMSENYAPVTPCLPDTQGFWRLPDIDSLGEQMREAFRKRAEWYEKGKLASEYVHTNLTWKQSAQRILSLTEEVLNEESIGNTAGVKRRKTASDHIEQLGTVCS
uniref:Putative glycosyltransferase n=1 Tax=viral metagenome TaxID=1070528 RepID=A0A6M3KDM2_9ZZZZ